MTSGLILFFFSKTVAGAPYYAHPEHSLDQSYQRTLAFLVTESLHRIADYHHDNPDQAHAVESELLNNPLITRLGFKTDSAIAIRTALNHWFHKFPNAGFTPQQISQSDLETIAHQLIRLTYRTTKTPRMTSPRQIIYATTDGPDAHYDDANTKGFRQTAIAFCAGRPAHELESALARSSSSTLISVAPNINRFIPAFFRNAVFSNVIGNQKTCDQLVEDVFEVNSPHRSPLDTNHQTEGLSASLAELYFRDNKLFDSLGLLSKTQALSDRKTVWMSLREKLPDTFADSDLIRLLATASHNHSLELYLVKVIFELVETPVQAATQAQTVFSDINHLYKLLTEHRTHRLTIAPEDFLANAERPYHFWGGAYVACEMTNRGYTPEIAEFTAQFTGQVYESLTSMPSANSAESNDDTKLHREGARFGIAICHGPTGITAF